MAPPNIKQVGKYQITEVLGRGGMGVIYKAIDPAIGRQVAIKMITGAFAEDPDLLKRFYREAQSTGNLQHPNIVTVYELGDVEGTPYLVMEFLEGEGLDRIIESKRPMPLVEKLSLVSQVCNGLSYAHQRNVVHRDIKPANVMVLRSGSIKIVDFGIARFGNEGLTRPGQIVGSIHYMSPEQINAVPVDARTDIFSTGVLLFTLLTHSLPFEGKDTGSTLLKILNSPAPPLANYVSDLPSELDEIIQQALAKDRDERYPSMDDMAFDLCRVLDRLKDESINVLLEKAESFMQNAEWETAREQVAQVFKIDRQNTRANMLNREILAAVQRQQRDQQVRQYRTIAEEAMAQKHFDDALAALDQALAFHKTNTQIIRLRGTVEQAKLQAEKVEETLRRARQAQAIGDFDVACTEIENVLELAPDHSEAKSLQVEIKRGLEERARRRQIADYLEEAKRNISLRRFAAALEVLRRAGILDPDEPRIHELEAAAIAGQEQERRRKELERLSSDIQEALTRDDYKAAYEKAESALETYPEHPGLLKLKALAEKQREAGEKRIYIEEQIGAARKLLQDHHTVEAVSCLQAALQKHPGDASLHSMLVMANETLAREHAEQKKSAYIRGAKEALRVKNFDEAIRILQAARAELQTSDFDDLLQFAHDEAAAYARQQKIEKALAEGQRLMAAEEFDSAVQFLESKLDELSDDELRNMLADARRHIEDFNAAVQEAIAAAARMRRLDKVVEAVRFLEGQLPSFAKSADFRSALDSAREHQERVQAISTAKENVRAALERSEFGAALEILQSCVHAFGETADLKSLREETELKRAQAATAVVEKAIRDARLVLLVRSYAAALEALHNAEPQLSFVTAELRAQFEAVKSEAEAAAERQRRIAELRNTLAAQADATRAAGSDSTTHDAHWTGAATATPIPLTPHPQDFAQLEAEMRRTRDLLDLSEIRDLSKAAPPQESQRDLLRDSAEDLLKCYPDDDEVRGLIAEIAQQLGAEGAATKNQVADDEPAGAVAATPELANEPVTGVEEEIARPVAEAASAADDSQLEMVEASGQSSPAADAQIVSESETAAAPPEAPEKMAQPPQLGPAYPAAAAQIAKEQQGGEDVAAQRGVATLDRPALETRNRFGVMAAIAAAVIAAVVLTVYLKRPGPTTKSSATSSAVANSPASAQAEKVTVHITTSPEHADVRVNGQSCTAPNCVLALPPGPYVLEARLQGYQPVTQQFTVDRSRPETATVSVVLPPVDAEGARPSQPEQRPAEAPAIPAPRNGITITGALPNTAIAVDGRAAGVVGLDGTLIAELRPGLHEIQLSNSGFETKRLRRRIPAGEMLRLQGKDVLLTKIEPPQSVPPPPPVQPARQPESTAVNKAPVSPAPQVQPPLAPSPPPATTEWAKLSGSRDLDRLEEFRRKYPNSPQAAEAARRIEQIKADATRSSPTPVAASSSADQDSVLKLLGRYAQAYNERNARSLTAVWPSLSRKELKKIEDAFRAAHSVHMDLHPLKPPVIEGDQATVSCARSLAFTFGGQNEVPKQDTVTLTLRKQANSWTIESVQ